MPRYPDTSSFVAELSEGVFSHLAERAKTMTGTVHPLHVGDTYLEPMPEARAEAQRCAEQPQLHTYAPVQGQPELLDAIADKLTRRTGVRPEREGLQVMAGATAGLTTVCTALLSPGDEVILPAPFWPLIRGIIRARGAVPVELPLFDRLAEPGFDPAAAIEAAVTDRTVAIYLNTPNNPTGAILSEQQLSDIGTLAERHALWVMSDEVYSDLYFGDTAPSVPSTIASLAPRTIANYSLSKAYALAGARVGFTHGPVDVMARIRGVQTFFTYCAARPMQLCATAALDHGDGWLETTRSLYAAAARATAQTFGVPAPQAGTFLFAPTAPYRSAGQTSMAWLERCLEAGVMLTPGSASGQAYGDWVRICFTCVAPDALDDALARLRGVIER